MCDVADLEWEVKLTHHWVMESILTAESSRNTAASQHNHHAHTLPLNTQCQKKLRSILACKKPGSEKTRNFKWIATELITQDEKWIASMIKPFVTTVAIGRTTF